MATGSFLSGLAGGYSTGESIKERKEIRGILDNLADTGGGSKSGGAQRDSTPYTTDAGESRPRSRGIVPEGDRELLALTLDAEAGGEGYDGMLAAGSVIANRAGQDGNVKDVIMKPGQFSAWNSVTGYAGGEGGLDMSARKPSEDAYRAADAILKGDYEDPTGGATHYYNPDVATPKWGQQAGGNWHKIGNHVFGRADAGRDSYTGPSGGAPKDTASTSQGGNEGNATASRGILSMGQKILDTFY